MSKTIDFVVADPSGNITIMVLTPVDRKDYKKVTQKLLELEELHGEQVAFILSEDPNTSKDASDSKDRSTSSCPENHTIPSPTNAAIPAMEMSGLEFCGNASRAFALYRALLSNPPLTGVTVKVSGCDHPLEAEIDTQAETTPQAGFVTMNMPLPKSFKTFTAQKLSLNKDGLLVSIDGISHLILEDVAPVVGTFERLKDFIYEEYSPDLPAFGVMFCDTINNMMTPVVYVKDVATTYFEGSCASGTMAASAAFADKMPDGTHDFTIQQPEGTLYTTVVKKNGRLENIYLKGHIKLSEVKSVTLP